MARKTSDGEAFGTNYDRTIQVSGLFGGKIRRYNYLKYPQRVALMLEPENISRWAEEERVNPAGELITFVFAFGYGKNYLFAGGRLVEDVWIQRGLSGIYNFYSGKNMPAGLRRIRFMAVYYLCRDTSGDWAATRIIDGEDAACSYNDAKRALETYCGLQKYVCGKSAVARISLKGETRSFVARVSEVQTASGDKRLVGITFFGSYFFDVSAADVTNSEPVSGNFNDGISRWVASGCDYCHIR